MKKYLPIVLLSILWVHTSILAAQENSQTSINYSDNGTVATFYAQQKERDNEEISIKKIMSTLHEPAERLKVYDSLAPRNFLGEPTAPMLNHLRVDDSLSAHNFLPGPLESSLDHHFSSPFTLGPPPKPIVRGGIKLPYVDPKELGIVDLFKGYNVDITSYFSYADFKPIEFKSIIDSIKFEPIKFEPIKFIFNDPVSIYKKLPEEPAEPSMKLDPPLSGQDDVEFIEEEEEKGKGKENEAIAEILDPYQIEKELIEKPVDQLNEHEVISLFKHLTNNGLFIKHDKVSFEKLKELIQDVRSRSLVLEASRGAEDLLQLAIKNSLFCEVNVLQVLFSNSEIVEYLATRKDEKGDDFLLIQLKVAVYLNLEHVVPLFYKSPFVFHHLYSTSRSAARINFEKIFFEAGLTMSFSSQKNKELEKLAYPTLMRYIEQDQKVLSQIVEQSIEERNSPLVRFLIETPSLSITPELLQDAIKIPALWNALSEASQQEILKKIQTINPNFTIGQLQTNHNFLRASEHALTGHPELLGDMFLYAPDLAERYQEAITKLQEIDATHDAYLDLFRQKKELERAFVNKLKELNPDGDLLTPPWSHAEAQDAYNRKVFGQGVTALVIELDALPAHQKERLLKSHLDEKTLYRKKTINSRTNHNIGVTSLISQMAPLSKIVSSTTREIETLKDSIQAAVYPFINCSWGPVSALDKSKSISIFSSVNILNNLLGREDIVLIKSAGNEGVSLSGPDLKGDPAGIFFSKLLRRLQPEQMTNLILAINLKPTNEVKSSSNTPGHSSDIFRNSLSAQGSNVYWLDEEGQEYLPVPDGGTSSAAPEITGAAALVKCYKPHFSPILVKNCLLHSGLREFMIYGKEGKPQEWIYENKPKEGISIPQSLYPFHKYGMGILNVKSALVFADILDAHIKEQKIEAPFTFEAYEKLRGELTGFFQQDSH